MLVGFKLLIVWWDKLDENFSRCHENLPGGRQKKRLTALHTAIQILQNNVMMNNMMGVEYVYVYIIYIYIYIYNN